MWNKTVHLNAGPYSYVVSVAVRLKFTIAELRSDLLRV